MAVMAAVVATLAYFPVCIAAVLLLRAVGVSFEAALTLGAALPPALGMLAWWLFVFVGACGYAAWLFPWGEPSLVSPHRD